MAHKLFRAGGEIIDPAKLKVGDRLKFFAFKSAWKVTATNQHFTICARRLSGALAEHEFVYTIVDWANLRRGPDSLIFGPKYNYLDPAEAKKALADLGDGRYHGRYIRLPSGRKKVLVGPQLELSYRRGMDLDLERVIRAGHGI